MTERRQSVIFLAMHKGGSSFLAGDLAKAIDSEIDGMDVLNIGNQVDDKGLSYDELAVPALGCAVVRVYPAEFDLLVEQSPTRGSRFSNVKLVALQRDPRDAAISRYFSIAYSHTPPKETEQEFLKRREDLVELGPRSGMLRMVKPTMQEFVHFHRILAERPDALLTTYEKMVIDYRGWLSDVGRHVGWTVAEQEALFAKTRDSFELPVLGDPTKHVRRITPGNWRRYDRQKIRDEFNELGGDLVTKSGYQWPELPS